MTVFAVGFIPIGDSVLTFRLISGVNLSVLGPSALSADSFLPLSLKH